MVARGSSLFDSRSYCEPTQSAWESISGRPVGRPVDTHLLSQVLGRGGSGRLGPSFMGWGVREGGAQQEPARPDRLPRLARGRRRLHADDQPQAGEEEPDRLDDRAAGHGGRTGRPRARPTAPCPLRRTDPAAPTDPAEPAPTDTPATEFVPGPGLPGKVVSAYAKGDTVVILITRKEGIDDDVMRSTVNTFDGKDGVTLFDTLAREIADYSRVTQGVDVDRVPAMIVLSPRKVSGEVPTRRSLLRLPRAQERRAGDRRRRLRGRSDPLLPPVAGRLLH